MDGHRCRTAAIATTAPFHNYPDVNNIAQYKWASYPGTPTPSNAFQQQCLHGQRQKGDKLLTFTRHIPLLLTLFCLFSLLLNLCSGSFARLQYNQHNTANEPVYQTEGYVGQDHSPAECERFGIRLHMDFLSFFCCRVGRGSVVRWLSVKRTFCIHKLFQRIELRPLKLQVKA
jgi:hypothetical protein